MGVHGQDARQRLESRPRRVRRAGRGRGRTPVRDRRDAAPTGHPGRGGSAGGRPRQRDHSDRLSTRRLRSQHSRQRWRSDRQDDRGIRRQAHAGRCRRHLRFAGPLSGSARRSPQGACRESRAVQGSGHAGRDGDPVQSGGIGRRTHRDFTRPHAAGEGGGGPGHAGGSRVDRRHRSGDQGHLRGRQFRRRRHLPARDVREVRPRIDVQDRFSVGDAPQGLDC